eukprot:g7906.t1
MSLKQEFCDELVSKCENQVTFPTSGASSYCEEHVEPNNYWDYPLPIIDFNVTLTEAFPSLGDYSNPPEKILSVKQSPDDSMLWIVDQDGEIIKVPPGDSGELAESVMDLGPHNTPTLDVNPTGVFWVASEEGLIDIAFDPTFTAVSGDAFYVSYSMRYSDDNKTRNRLSKFLYYPGNPALTRASEDVLLTTITKIAPIHSSGWVDFKPSDFANPGSVGTPHDIYWSVGDGGKKVDQQNRGQDATNLLGAIIRISVSATTAGYTIPADGNNIAAGPGPEFNKEEICAYGFRNPFRCGFDQETDKLYCGDVGHFRVEEIDLIECGNNYGWKILEGGRCQIELDPAVNCDDWDTIPERAGFTDPYFQYCHGIFDSTEASQQPLTAGQDICGDRQITGRCVIGGYVYHGSLYGDLFAGAYIFGDNETKNIHYLLEADDGTMRVGNIISDGTVEVISFAQTNDGEMMVIAKKDGNYVTFFLPCGDLCEPTCLPQSENLPTYQFEGCFTEVASDPALSNQAPGCPDDEGAMTVQICASYCGTLAGMNYMGLHAGGGCSCGSAANYGRHGTATTCNMPCTGLQYRPAPAHPGAYLLYSRAYYPSPGRIMTLAYKNSDNYAQKCSERCSDSQFFATQYGRECWCGFDDGYNQHGASTGCDVPCTGDATEICGGSYAASVYENNGFDPDATPAPTPAPAPFTPLVFTEKGCYTDKRNDRIMTLEEKRNDMTSQVCAGMCAGSPAFATQNGNECWCGSTGYARHGTSTGCTKACAGDAAEICGGRFASTVYEF